MELEKRVKTLARRLTEKDIDFALILQNVDLFYFAGSIWNIAHIKRWRCSMFYKKRRGKGKTGVSMGSGKNKRLS